MLKTVFFGTPSVAVPFLEKLAALSRVAGVVTAPDKPAGRGYDLRPPPVKTRALELGLPLLQPESMKGFSLSSLGPLDVGLVVAYGKFLPASVFDVPSHGLVNVHFSLLPKYRGAGPVQWALIRGEIETGVSLFRIEKGMDTGPLYFTSALPILPEDDSATLRGRLADSGLTLVEALVESIEQGRLTSSPQNGAPSLAPLLKKEDGLIRWDERSAREISDLIRGTFEWPGAFSQFRGKTVKIRRAEVVEGEGPRPGEILSLRKGEGLLVQCRSGRLSVRALQPEGKKEMSADDFWNGFRPGPGECFSNGGTIP